MGELQNIFVKLNIMDQVKLNKYINAEVNKKLMTASQDLEKLAGEKEKKLTEMNDNTWSRIELFLHRSMRELHISEERIKKIDARVLELSNESENLLIGEEMKSDYKILDDADFQKTIELLINSSCKNCKNHSKKCEVHQLLKKYNIPHSGEKGKCKYAYFKIGKEFV